MLIKITTGLPAKAIDPKEAPNFVLFDHAEEIEFGPATEFTSNRSFDEFVRFRPAHDLCLIRYLNPHVEHALFSDPAKKGDYEITERHRYIANSIVFTRQGQRHRVVFDGVAYICTDDGKTLERVYAGGGYNTGEEAAA
jgi:hypothetical protein